MFFPIQSSSRSQMIDITPKIQETIDAAGITDGMVMVFSPHTTAAVTINENADPSVPVDIETIPVSLEEIFLAYYGKGNGGNHA